MQVGQADEHLESMGMGRKKTQIIPSFPLKNKQKLLALFSRIIVTSLQYEAR